MLGLPRAGERAFELAGLDGFEDFADGGAGFPAEREEVAAGDERLWDDGGYSVNQVLPKSHRPTLSFGDEAAQAMSRTNKL